MDLLVYDPPPSTAETLRTPGELASLPVLDVASWLFALSGMAKAQARPPTGTGPWDGRSKE